MSNELSHPISTSNMPTSNSLEPAVKSSTPPSLLSQRRRLPDESNPDLESKKIKLGHNASPVAQSSAPETFPRSATEPPTLDYSLYTHYSDVQKIFHEVGGSDLPWRSSVLDLAIERNLLCDYRTWVLGQLDNGQLDDKSRAFFGELYADLWIEHDAVVVDVKGNNERWGRTGKDRVELRRFMKSVGKEMRKFREDL